MDDVDHNSKMLEKLHSREIPQQGFTYEELKINSHNEWDTLREVIVGTADGSMAVLTWPRPEPIPEAVLKRAYQLAQQAFPQWFIDEVNEDLNEVCNMMKRMGIKVFRPK